MSIFVEVHKAFRRIPESVTVIQYPNDSSPFSQLLDLSLRDSGLSTDRFPIMTSHKGLNLFLYPFWTLFLKNRGASLVNIHWITGPWQTPSINSSFKRSLLWCYFKVWIRIIKFLGLKIVYTVHDHEPHSKVFNDDKKSVEYLIKQSDGIVFLNTQSSSFFRKKVVGKSFNIIPEGSIRHDVSKSREEMRSDLGVPVQNKLLILIGSLQEYKGVDLILEKIQTLPRNVSIRIAGNCPSQYRKELSAQLDIVKDRGLDLRIDFGFLNDQDFGNYLQAADYFLYPCREINNSGSLNAALSHGLPVIVPRTKGLEWVPSNCKVFIEGDKPEYFDIEGSIVSLADISDLEYQKLSRSALNFSETRSWTVVSQKYIQFYNQTLLA
jgi:glycosyltransferase involved in cell wall biosynthesis